MNFKLTLFVLFSLFAGTASAQNWGGGVDDEPVHFGFTFQYISSEFKILKKANWQTPFMDPEGLTQPVSPLRSISSSPSPGFGIGFVVNNRLGENADIRFTPVLVFNDRSINYEYDNSADNNIKKVQTTLVEFPLGIKLKSNRRNNFRAYILGGLNIAQTFLLRKRPITRWLLTRKKSG
jgi:hypothetical protein